MESNYNSPIKDLISHQELRERLEYNPETGHFYWKPKIVNKPHDKSWNTRYAGTRAGSLNKKHNNKYSYLELMLNYNRYIASRVAIYYMTGTYPETMTEVIHIDGDKFNNSYSNLKLVHNSDPERRINCAVYKSNKSGRKGVTWDKKSRKWRAHVKDNHLGFFDDKSEAIKAREEGERLFY